MCSSSLPVAGRLGLDAVGVNQKPLPGAIRIGVDEDVACMQIIMDDAMLEHLSQEVGHLGNDELASCGEMPAGLFQRHGL